MTISKIWINEGCIACHTCEDRHPDIFHVTDDGDCIINASIRADGIASNNRAEKAMIKSNLDPKLELEIVDIAANCPIKIIEIELNENGVVEKTSPKIEAQSQINNLDGSINLDKRTIKHSGLPLPSLKLYTETKTSNQIGEDVTSIADSTTKSKANDIVVPVPDIATDSDLIRLQKLLGYKVEEAFQQAGEITCQVAKENILEALTLCRDDVSLGYEMLADQTATHYPTAKTFTFSVVYHLTSIRRSKRLRLRILIPEKFEPDSAVTLYPAANWMEREIWDMLGIRFKNHPNMTRILCPEDWEGHALRKDYPVQGQGQRNINFREDRSGMLMRIALEKANNIKINSNPPKAE